MNLDDDLVNTIITFTQLLTEAKTPCVATWKPFFMSTCTDWCLYIETELALLSEAETERVIKLAHEKSQLEIPPSSVLLDALHTFFHTLIENVYTSNSLYLYIMKNYQFLTMPEGKDIILQKVIKVFACVKPKRRRDT
jgi:hypothetical protein